MNSCCALLLASFWRAIACAAAVGSLALSAAEPWDTMRARAVRLQIGTHTTTDVANDLGLKQKLEDADGRVRSFYSTMLTAGSRTSIWSDLPLDVSQNPGLTLDQASRNLAYTYNRLLPILQAYYTPNGPNPSYTDTTPDDFYGNVALRDKVVSALNWLNDHYYSSAAPVPVDEVDPETQAIDEVSWYQYRVAVPKALTGMAVLLKSATEPTGAAKVTGSPWTTYMGAVAYFVPSPRSTTPEPVAPKMTAGNLTFQTYVVAMRAIITEDVTAMGVVKEVLEADNADSDEDIIEYRPKNSTVFSPDRDGFYDDGSFIQHAAYGYIGGYGRDMLLDLAQILYVTDGTTYACRTGDRNTVYQWIFDSAEPFVYNRDFMDSVTGRTNAGGPTAGRKIPSRSAAGVISAAYVLSETALDAYDTDGDNDVDANDHPIPYKSALRSLLKRWLADDGDQVVQKGGTVFTYSGLKGIAQSGSIPPMPRPRYYRQFPIQDNVVQWRDTYTAAVTMSSARVGDYESGNQQNIKGWYTGDGALYLYNADDTKYRNFWQTVNSRRIPGTTIDTFGADGRELASNWVNFQRPQTWVGGAEGFVDPATLEAFYGVSGMDLQADNDRKTKPRNDLAYTFDETTDLVAKKSWIFFDNEVVALGAGITAHQQGTDHVMETIVENHKLRLDDSNGVKVGTDNGGGGITETSVTASVGSTPTVFNNVRWAHIEGNKTGDASTNVGYYFPTSLTLKGLRELRKGNFNEIYARYNNSGKITFTPTQDTFFDPDGSSGDANFRGSRPYLYVKNNTADASDYRSYVKFNLRSRRPGYGDPLEQNAYELVASSADLVMTPLSWSGTFFSSYGVAAQRTSLSPNWVEVDTTVNGVTTPALDADLTLAGSPTATVTVNSTDVGNSTTPAVPTVFPFSGTEAATLFSQSLTGTYASFSLFQPSASSTAPLISFAAKENLAGVAQLRFNGYRENYLANYATFWIDHGSAPLDAAYSYVVLPGSTPTSLTSYASAPDVVILSNTKHLQAAKEKTLGVLGANFWDTTETLNDDGQSFVSVDLPASVMTRETFDYLDVSVSDPTQNTTANRAVQLIIQRKGSSTGTTSVDLAEVQAPTSWNPLTVRFPVADRYGKTVRARFKLDPVYSRTATADFYVRNDGSAATASAATLVVKNDAGDSFDRKANLKFQVDISAYSGPIRKAYLQLYPTHVPATETWHEATITTAPYTEATGSSYTWATASALETSANATYRWKVPATAGTPVTIDITAQLQSGSGTLAIMIRAPAQGGSSDYTDYASSNHGTITYRPSLILK